MEIVKPNGDHWIEVDVAQVENLIYADLGAGEYAWLLGELLKFQSGGHTVLRDEHILFYNAGAVGGVLGEKADYQALANSVLARV